MRVQRPAALAAVLLGCSLAMASPRATAQGQETDYAYCWARAGDGATTTFYFSKSRSKTAGLMEIGPWLQEVSNAWERYLAAHGIKPVQYGCDGPSVSERGLQDELAARKAQGQRNGWRIQEVDF